MKSIKNSKGIETLIFAETLEYEALEQIKKMINFEAYLESKVRIMPDTHAGKGCTVGTTMTIEDKVTPNLVGVDIGCFSGETKVKLADGRDLSFLELIEEDKNGKENFCYSLDKNNNIIISKIKFPRKIKNVNELLNITLDNGEIIKCTPDHIFYKRNGEKIEAKDLKIFDSLMPFYIKKSEEIDIKEFSFKDKRNKLKGYDIIYNPNTNKWDYAHFLANDYNIRNNIYFKKGIRHHKDFNKNNNNPSNIEILDWKSHWIIHSIHAKELNKKGLSGFKKAWENNFNKFSEMSSEKMKKLHKDPEFCRRRDKRAAEIFKKFNKTEKFKEISEKAGQRGKKYLIDRNKSEKGRKKSSEIAHGKYTCEICKESFVGSFRLYNHQQKEHCLPQECKKCGRIFKNDRGLITHHRFCKNHVITNIEKEIVYNFPVYCLTIDNYSNFALSSGVFVHNCGILTIEIKDKNIDFKKLDEIIKKYVPHGFEVHSRSSIYKPKFDFSGLRCHKSVDLQRALNSIGTLGGGNHFIELAHSEKTGSHYLIIHSGSRKLGSEVCKLYQDKAFKRVNEMGEVKKSLIKKLTAEGRKSEIASEIKKLQKPKVDKDLAYLVEEDFDDYMNDMEITQRFAIENRKGIAKIIIAKMGFTEVSRFETIHNYIDFRRKILRKGAVSSEDGETILIPINMKDGSLLCVGKGNPEWNYSAPHGAGRLLSRSKAKANLDMDEFKKSMKGIYTSSVVPETLDEAPQAYKSMDEIIRTIGDTAEVIDILKPLYNFKSH